MSVQREHLPDALDPSRPATQVVSFELDGVNYRIALDDEHARALRASVAPFIRRARVVFRAPLRAVQHVAGGSAPARRDPSQTAAIRSWAIREGLLEPGKAKRVPDSVVEAWEAAHRA